MAQILNQSGMYAVIERHFWEWETLKRSVGHLLHKDGLTDFSRVMRVGLWAHIVPDQW